MLGRSISLTVLALSLAGLLIFDAAAIAASAGKKPSKGAARNEKFALLIGIDDYINGDPPLGGRPRGDLEGCVNDSTQMKRLLIERYKFPPQNVKTLLNKEATRDAILKAFDEHLIANAKTHRNSTIVLAYSGHGDRQTDGPDNDEEDGLDETLIPADFRMNKRGDSKIKPIIDDEIQSRFKQLSKFTKNITFILDCCHSATGTRAISQRALTRRLPEDISLEVQRKPSSKASRTRGGSFKSDNEILERSADYVTISGCRSEQESGETISGPRHGVMTISLLSAIKNAPGNVTYRQIYEDMRARALRNPGGWNVPFGPQEPQIEGDLDRIFLGDSSMRHSPSLSVIEVVGGKVKIPVGTSGGVDIGTQIASYKPTAQELKGRKDLLFTARIDAVAPTTSEFAAPAGISTDLVKKSQVVIVTPNFGSKSIIVDVDSESMTDKNANDFAKTLRDELKQNPMIKLRSASSQAQDWTLRVKATSFETFSKLVAEGDSMTSVGKDAPMPAPASTVIYITEPNGKKPLYNFFVPIDLETATQETIRVLEKKAKQDNLKALANLRSDLKNKVSIDVIQISNGGAEQALPRDALAGDIHFKIGDNYKFRVKNNGDTPLFVSLILIGSGGSIRVLHPPEGGSEKLVPGAQFTTRIFPAVAPLGKDTFKFVITTKDADFHFLEQDGLVARKRGLENESEHSKIDTRKSSQLVGFLQNNLGYTTRDVGDPEDNPDPEEWDATFRTVVVGAK